MCTNEHRIMCYSNGMAFTAKKKVSNWVNCMFILPSNEKNK